MLRGIYAFYLSFFILLLFLIGICLIPFGFTATLIIKIRLLWRSKIIKFKQDGFMQKPSSRKHLFLGLKRDFGSFLVFILFGPIILFIQNFKDSLHFARDCWKERPKRSIPSHFQSFSPLFTER